MAEISLEDELNDINLTEIAENIFIELDIVKKGYHLCFGEGLILEELEFVHSNFGIVLSQHEENHDLYDVDINKIKITGSEYRDENDNLVDMIEFLKDEDKIKHFIDLLINSKLGMMGIFERGYFNYNGGDIIPVPEIITIILRKIDEIILRMNIVLNKLA